MSSGIGWTAYFAFFATTCIMATGWWLVVVFFGPLDATTLPRLPLAVIGGAVALAVYLAVLGWFVSSDPRVWRRDSAFVRRVVARAPEVTDCDIAEFRLTVMPSIACNAGLSFGFCGAMALLSRDFGAFLAFAVLGSLVVGSLLLTLWSRD